MSKQEVDIIFAQVKKLVGQQKYEESIELLQRISKDDSPEQYARAQVRLGRVYRQLGDFEKAEATLKSVLREYNAEQYARAQLDLGFLYKQQAEYKKAEKAYKNIAKEDPSEWYARSLVNLANLYRGLKKFKQAEKTFKLVLHEYDVEQYARAQVELGRLHKQQGDYKNAEEIFRNISKNDSIEWYAQGLVNLGQLYGEQKKFDQAEATLKSVLREYNSEQYARAQMCLGILYKQQGDYNNTEEILRNISKDDSIEWYTRSLVNLGDLYCEQKQFKQAEETLKLVLKGYDVEEYARAQVGLGILYKQQGDFEKAENAYKNITIGDSSEWYALGLVNLANLYREQERFEQAEETFKSVLKEYNAEAYVRAQVGLGYLYKQQGDYEKAEIVYKNISKEDSSEWYARSLINLANLYREQAQFEQAKETLKLVLPKYSTEAYAKAQWNLSVLTKNKKFLKKIKINHDLEIFSEAQFVLGVESNSVIESNRYWQAVPIDTMVYKSKKYIIDLTKKIVAVEICEYQWVLFEALKITNNILENIFVDTIYENSIAHYTNVTVSKLLLSYQQNEEKMITQVRSPLRLNTINLMNDPVEGRLLYQFLGLNQDNEDLSQDTKNQAFIACFTLHHDSLNQFRLYGKHQNQEASGLSLVLNKEFFADTHNAASIYRYSGTLESELKEPAVDSLKDLNNQQKRSSFNKHAESNSLIGRVKQLPQMPLYRCIYLDPVSNYIKVAQREEWSFCREDKCSSSKHWDEYQEAITVIEQDTRALLEALSKLISEISAEQINGDVGQLLSEILIPLKYLIKHMAFKEEQECRMVHITGMDNDLVKYDENINRVYIDYAPSVMQHLEKIYLAPKAKDEQIVFEYICTQAKKMRSNKDGVKVKISQNPFR